MGNSYEHEELFLKVVVLSGAPSVEGLKGSFPVERVTWEETEQGQGMCLVHLGSDRDSRVCLPS